MFAKQPHLVGDREEWAEPVSSQPGRYCPVCGAHVLLMSPARGEWATTYGCYECELVWFEEELVRIGIEPEPPLPFEDLPPWAVDLARLIV